MAHGGDMLDRDRIMSGAEVKFAHCLIKNLTQPGRSDLFMRQHGLRKPAAMQGGKVSPTERAVQIESGAKLGDLDHAAHAFGMDVPGGRGHPRGRP